jgi:hypothetical protein
MKYFLTSPTKALCNFISPPDKCEVPGPWILTNIYCNFISNGEDGCGCGVFSTPRDLLFLLMESQGHGFRANVD